MFTILGGLGVWTGVVVAGTVAATGVAVVAVTVMS